MKRTLKHRNPMAAVVRQPQFKKRVVKDKKREANKKACRDRFDVV